MKTKTLVNRKVQIAFGAAFLILAMVAAFSYRAIVASGESDRWVRHTHNVIENLQGFHLAAVSIEASTSSFVLTGEASSVDAYRASIVNAEEHGAALRNLTQDNAEQQRRLAVLDELTAQQIRFTEMVINLRRTEGLAAAADALRARDPPIMDELQTEVRQMRDEELRLLAGRNADATRDIDQTKAIVILGTILGLLITLVAGWSVQHDGFRRRLAEEALRGSEKYLAQIRDTEKHLAHKIEELSRSNEELEQFAYVASHDLQEPLRMVASYTQILSKRYKGKLDSDADEFIAFAVDGATRMQKLIQDLLTYSRVGTRECQFVDISSEKALQQALISLQGAIEDSGALVTHDPLPTVLVDETQLIQLFQNLVGNAIKYQNPGTPRIHISAARNNEKKWVFSVKDNGLGIDPKYFRRIFGMFQRLHKREEFAGTGIGLAICKKIVERHGGNITVESTPGQGSIFRFALQQVERKS